MNYIYTCRWTLVLHVLILIMINVNFVWNVRNFVKVELMGSFGLDPPVQIITKNCPKKNKCRVWIRTNFSPWEKWTTCSLQGIRVSAKFGLNEVQVICQYKGGIQSYCDLLCYGSNVSLCEFWSLSDQRSKRSFFFLQDLTERPYCKTKSTNEAIITWCQKKLQIEVWRSTHLNNITPGLVSSVKTKSVLLSLED